MWLWPAGPDAGVQALLRIKQVDFSTQRCNLELKPDE